MGWCWARVVEKFTGAEGVDDSVCGCQGAVIGFFYLIYLFYLILFSPFYRHGIWIGLLGEGEGLCCSCIYRVQLSSPLSN